MSTLVLAELITTLSQDFTVSKRQRAYAIRPELYIHNNPAGNLTVSLKKGSTTLASSTQSIADIVSTAGLSAYSWGVVRFILDDEVTLKINTTYTLELSSSGYTFAESGYVGWLNSWENNKNTLVETASDSFHTDRSFELWSYK